MPRYTDHVGLPITTQCREAATRYAEGIELLVRSAPDALPALRAAVAADPALGVARAALALAVADLATVEDLLLDVVDAHGASASASRRERQHIEVVAVALRGDADRARALALDHLREFPDDVVVAYVVSR